VGVDERGDETEGPVVVRFEERHAGVGEPLAAVVREPAEPEVLDGHLREVFLPAVDGLVARLPEAVPESLAGDAFRNLVEVVEVVRPDTDLAGEAPGPEARSRGHTDRVRTVGPLEAGPVFGQAVHPRGFEVGVPGTAHHRGRLLIREEDDEVWMVF